MKIRTPTLEHGRDGQPAVPTLTVGQVQQLLGDALQLHGPDELSWIGPRYSAIVEVYQHTTVQQAVDLLRDLLPEDRPWAAAPHLVARMAAEERYRRRCRLWHDPSLPIVQYRRSR